MSTPCTLTDSEESNLYKAKKLMQLIADLATPGHVDYIIPIDREALAVFAQVVEELLPKV